MAIHNSGEKGNKNANNGISDLVFGDASKETPLWKYGILKSMAWARALFSKKKKQFEQQEENNNNDKKEKRQRSLLIKQKRKKHDRFENRYAIRVHNSGTEVFNLSIS